MTPPSFILLQTCTILFSLLAIITSGYFINRISAVKNSGKEAPVKQMRIFNDTGTVPVKEQPQFSTFSKGN